MGATYSGGTDSGRAETVVVTAGRRDRYLVVLVVLPVLLLVAGRARRLGMGHRPA